MTALEKHKGNCARRHNTPDHGHPNFFPCTCGLESPIKLVKGTAVTAFHIAHALKTMVVRIKGENFYDKKQVDELLAILTS